MQKISVLIFSLNKPEDTLAAVKHIYNIADQIVIVDSSPKKTFQRLQKMVASKKLTKVELHYTVALGYAEPMRTYGFSLCRNEWVLLLDVDERLSKALRHDIREIVGLEDADVLKVRRYEDVPLKGPRTNFYTWQIRIFKRDKLEYLGLTHENPKILGRDKKLTEQEYYMVHVRDLKQGNDLYYNKMDLFSTKHPMNLILRDLVLGIFMSKDVRNFSDVRKTLDTHMAMDKKRTQEVREIAKIIHTKGIIKYLDLDKPSTFEKLNKKYANKKQGIGLLIELLNDRYHGKYLS